MVKTLKWFLDSDSRTLPFRYSPGSQVASAEALQGYLPSLRPSFAECMAPFELPSHFTPSLGLEFCTQLTSACKKGSREAAAGEGKWAVTAQPSAWEGARLQVCKYSSPRHLLGTELSRDSLLLSPDLLLPALSIQML